MADAVTQKAGVLVGFVLSGGEAVFLAVGFDFGASGGEEGAKERGKW